MTKQQIGKKIYSALKKNKLLDESGDPKYSEIFLATQVNYRTVKGIVEGSVDFRYDGFKKLCDYLDLTLKLD